MAESTPSTGDDVIASDVLILHKKITAAFEAFDYNTSNAVDVREIGTIIYSLGCFPTQKDIHEFIAEVEDNHTGCVHLDRFLPAMTQALLEHKFPPIPEDILLQAFEVLDKEEKGYMNSEDIIEFMTKDGDAFTQEEMTEMLTALADNEEKRIYYKDVISQLTFDSDV